MLHQLCALVAPLFQPLHKSWGFFRSYARHKDAHSFKTPNLKDPTGIRRLHDLYQIRNVIFGIIVEYQYVCKHIECYRTDHRLHQVGMGKKETLKN